MIQKFKSWYASKVNWSAILLILLAAKDAIGNLDISKMTTKDWITAGIGAAIFIFRTFFGGSTIGSATEVKTQVPDQK